MHFMMMFAPGASCHDASMPIKRVIVPIDPVVTIVPMWAGYVEHWKYDFLERALRAGWDDKRHGSVLVAFPKLRQERVLPTREHKDGSRNRRSLFMSKCKSNNAAAVLQVT